MMHQQDLGEIYMYLLHLRRDATISSIQIIAVVYFSRIDIPLLFPNLYTILRMRTTYWRFR